MALSFDDLPDEAPIQAQPPAPSAQGGLSFDDLPDEAPAAAPAQPVQSAAAQPWNANDLLPESLRPIGRAIDDYGLSLSKGFVGAAEAVTGLGDIVSGGRVSPAMKSGLGYDPAGRRAEIDRMATPQHQQAMQQLDRAQGFAGTLQALRDNPSLIPHAVAESLPSMALGGAAGRGIALGAKALGAAPGLAGMIGAGAGEGLVASGQQASQTVQQTGTLTPGQTALAVGAGIGTGLLGMAGARIGRKLGVMDIDAQLAGANGVDVAKGMVNRALTGTGIESLEELTQSGQQQVLSNLANDRPVLENVDKQMVLGGVVGGAMGGAGGLRHPTVNTPAEQPAVPPAALIDPRIEAARAAVPNAIRSYLNPEQATPAPPVPPLAPQPVPERIPFAASSDIAPMLRNIGMDEARAKQTMDLLSPVEDEVEAKRRGVLPIAEQQRLASMIGLKGDRADAFARQVGETWSPETIIAATNNVAAQYRDVLALQQKITSGRNVTDEDRAEFVQRLGDMRRSFGDLAGARAEAGRSMAAFRGSNFDFNRTQNILEGLGTGGVDDLAKAFGAAVKAGGIQNAARIIKQPDTLMQRVFGYYYRSLLLSNPATQVANAVGNAGMVGKLAADRAGAAAIGSVKKMLGYKNETMWREPVALLRGNAANLLNAGQAAGQAFMQGDNPNTSVNAVEFASDINAPSGILHKAASLPYRGLAAGDAFFQTVHQGGEMRALATRQAVGEKQAGTLPKGVSLSQRIDQILADPSPQMIERAGEYSRRATFNQTAGPLVKGVLGLKRRLPILQVILPFLRTPTNIAKEVLGSTPLAGLTPKFWEDVRAGGAAQEQALGKVLTGTAFMTAALLAASEGYITGSGAGMDDDERKALEAAGWQPYSVLVDGKYHSIQRLDPFSSMLALAADLSRMNPSEDSAGKMAGALLGSFVANVSDKTALAGLKNAAVFLADPANRGAWYLKNVLGTLAQPATLLSTAAAGADPYARETASVLDQIKYRTPGFRQDLPVKLDAWGEPVENTRQGWSPLFIPSTTSTESTDPVRQMAARLSYTPTEFQRSMVLNGRKIQIPDDQHHELVQLAGRLTHRGAQRLMRSPGWASLDDEQKRDALEKMATKARAAVRMAAIPYVTSGKRAALDKLRDQMEAQR
jgi:hypothetical protein